MEFILSVVLYFSKFMNILLHILGTWGFPILIIVALFFLIKRNKKK